MGKGRFDSSIEKVGLNWGWVKNVKVQSREGKGDDLRRGDGEIQLKR